MRILNTNKKYRMYLWRCKKCGAEMLCSGQRNLNPLFFCACCVCRFGACEYIGVIYEEPEKIGKGVKK
jgi:hypothetical protein